MMLEISQKLKEPPAVAVTGTSTPTSSGHAPPSTESVLVADLPCKETAGEAPFVMPIIINLDPPLKENPTPRLSEESEKCLAKMEERLCALHCYELKGADRLSSYIKANFLENFQEPEFIRKYDETGCPMTHLRYYVRKMARYADNQYRFNIELTPTRDELTRIEKKRNESFKAFAQRWRTVALQVKPPLNEREMRHLFLKTLPPEYF
ncbi:uncharacterized protein LOC120291905 [Eucalyptus grandis]|uniref:uncharacterized protein LOC120291905 n=1 Tax=Eucalyptus grandis TaxID=71139 RepID=UPI00192EAE76|nr:uncharacterized protein LOC120291905 [Eucalyptus grandis]